MAKTYILIRKLVRRTSMSIPQLSLRIKASEKSIYKWMNGSSKPNCEHLLALFEAVEDAEKRH